MERLTEKRYLGNRYYTKCTETCFLEDIDCGDCEKFDTLLDRLGAYEDTGLMPEEITAAIAANDTARTFVEKMADFGGTEAVKRLRELAEADKDGRMVNDAPTADVAPVRHGRWEQCFEDWRKQIEGDKCSACGFEHYDCSIRSYRYCPNCGAKMRGADHAE